MNVAALVLCNLETRHCCESLVGEGLVAACCASLCTNKTRVENGVAKANSTLGMGTKQFLESRNTALHSQEAVGV